MRSAQGFARTEHDDMTTKAERQAADVQHNGTPFLRANHTTANGELVAIPAEWLGKYVDFTALGADVFVRFGSDNTVQVSASAVSTNTSGTLAATGKEPHLIIPAGSTKPERIKLTGWTHFAWIASAASGTSHFVPSTGDGL
jgi:hypothetical protein